MNDQGVVSIRFRPGEAELVRKAAAAEDMSVSAYLRNLALKTELLSRPGARTFRATSGAEVAWWSNQPGVFA